MCKIKEERIEKKVKRLYKYLSGYKKECLLAPLFKMLEASFELFVPLVVASMIDKGMANADKTYIIKCCGILFLLATVGLISALTAQFFAAKAAVGFATELRQDLFSHLLNLSFREYDEIGSSTMITRMTSDVMSCQTGVNWFLRLMLRSPFVVFGAMIMAFTIDFKAALVFLGVIIILFAVVALIMKSNIPLLEKAQGLLDNVLRRARENLLGVRVLRAFSREGAEKEAFDQGLNDLYMGQMKAAGISSLMNPVTYIVINMAIVCLIYVGAIRVNNGALSQGSVVALYNYMSQILVELIKLANMFVTSAKALASANRIAAVLDIDNSQLDEKISDCKKLNQELISENDIQVEFSRVSFKYSMGGDNALNDISFKINAGEIVGIIGGTGSGKTTLVSLVPRFYEPYEGDIMIFGRKSTEWSINELRDKIGFVFQKPALFSGTIASNLLIGNQNADEKAMFDAMEKAVATDVINSKSDGLYADVGEGGKALSGGQKQRITIARALIKRPEILIFDDSTSALDFATQAKFLNNLKTLDYKPTVFIVSQRTNCMLSADRIIVLDDGNMVAQGKHEELLNTCDIYREIHTTGFGGMEVKTGGEKNE